MNDSAATAQHIEISPADLKIFGLAAAGYTNIAIAHEVESTARHVGERIRAVQNQLAAPTKTAAVVQLIRAGRL